MTAADVEAPLAFYKQTRENGRDFDAGIRSGVARILSSPSFLYRIERDPAASRPGAAHTIMLDNFSLDDLRAGVAQIGGRALVEASGGITLETIKDVAATGVDIISVGALTHSVRALDLGLDIKVS